MDDKVAEFRAITNTSVETAIHMLEAFDGNLETAVNYFLQHNDQNSHDQEPSSSGGASAQSDVNSVDDLVRAPIAPKSAVLVEESFHKSYAPIRRPKQTDSVFERFRDFEAESNDLEVKIVGEGVANKDFGRNNKRKTLELLFRPPLEIMHRGTLETAKADAVSRGYWLMVNVQKTDEFACQVMNRDVWNNAAVQDLIRNNFILWQIYSDSAEGQRFGTYYRMNAFPFVGIVDPRTGELLKSIKMNDAMLFCDEVSAFLDENPSFKQHDSNRIRNAKVVVDSQSSGHGAGVDSASATIPKNHAKSGLHGAGKRKRANNGDEDVGNGLQNGYREPKPKLFRLDEDSSSGTSTCSSVSIGIQLPKRDPVNSSLVPFGEPEVKLMFRLPDGSRRFVGALKRTTVRDILNYAQNEWNLDLSTYDFVMNFPMRQFKKEDPNKTLQELGVQKQDTIYVEEI